MPKMIGQATEIGASAETKKRQSGKLNGIRLGSVMVRSWPSRLAIGGLGSLTGSPILCPKEKARNAGPS
jgi:hypothetical protein